MPTTYAHYRFGCTVYRRLPEREKALIDACRPLYDFGLHGPDVLFYYRPFLRSPVRALGGSMHNQTGREVFAQAGARLAQEDDQRPLLAYTYGFLCHFVLDSMCHGYVAQKMADSGLSHAEIEAEFDRALLVRDGRDPLRSRVTQHLRPTAAHAAVLSRFFPGVTPRQMHEAMRSMVRELDVLAAQTRLGRGALRAALALTCGRGMRDLVLRERPNPACFDSSEELARRYAQAQPQAVDAIVRYLDIVDGRAAFSGLFDRTFDPAPEAEGEVWT